MIWGESYAGVFVPTLANLVYESDLKLNFLGFSVGDPCTSEKYQHLGDQLHFNLGYAYHNGFISATSYGRLLHDCSKRDWNGNLAPDYSTPQCVLEWRVYFLQTSNNDGQNPLGFDVEFGKTGKFINTFNNYGPNGGPFDTMLRDYLSSPEVKEALHVSEAPVERWGMGENLVYTKEHLACFYEEGTPQGARPKFDWDMLEIYRKLAGNVPRIVVFNGDTDPDVQYRGTEGKKSLEGFGRPPQHLPSRKPTSDSPLPLFLAAIESLGLDVKEGGGWRPWFFTADGASSDLMENKTPYWGELLSLKPAGPQLGGYVKVSKGWREERPTRYRSSPRCAAHQILWLMSSAVVAAATCA